MRYLVFAARAQRHKGIFVLCLSCLATLGYAQGTATKIKEFSTEEVSKVSIDRLGDFYLVLTDGSIKKYDTLGNYMSEFSSPDLPLLTLLEPWNPLRVFVYSQKRQEIVLLNHTLGLEQRIAVDPSWAVEPILACPAILTNFWVLDKSDLSLKMIDSKTKAVGREINLRLPDLVNPEFIYLREYQSLIFLVDRTSGVYVFNTVGVLVHTIPAKNLGYIGFLGEEFYYLEDGKLKFYDLYTEDRHELMVDASARFVLMTDAQMVVVKKSTVEVWAIAR
jgi:hypothetical protein